MTELVCGMPVPQFRDESSRFRANSRFKRFRKMFSRTQDWRPMIWRTKTSGPRKEGQPQWYRHSYTTYVVSGHLLAYSLAETSFIHRFLEPTIFSVRDTSIRPPLWSSDKSPWLQIQRPWFDSRHYQKKNVVGLEQGPLSLVSTSEELLDRKVAAPVLRTENKAVGIRHADHVTTSISKNWQSLRRKAAVARSV
jgi:hypothetical protein